VNDLDAACPRCGARRDAGQEYCIECGLRLPATGGLLARARNTWIRHVGWYPGDWAWPAALALVLAAVAATAAILSTGSARSSTASDVLVATAGEPVPLGMPAQAAFSSTADTSTLPTPPEPTTTAARPGAQPLTRWPAGKDGWTVVLESVPASVTGRKTALKRAKRAAAAGLPEVGLLVTSRYATLHPGYLAIFSGVLDTREEAESNLRAATSAGFSGAYVREISQ
jgi:hypothetical protein